jgi:hypothetical protein
MKPSILNSAKLLLLLHTQNTYVIVIYIYDEKLLPFCEPYHCKSDFVLLTEAEQ